MGYRDYELCLGKSQAVAADGNSTDYLDTELTYPYWNKGQPAAIIVSVEAVSVAGTGCTFEVCHKASEPTTGDATLCTAVVLAADLTAGKQVVIPLPMGVTMLRYIRLYYNVTAGTESYTFSAYFTPLQIGIQG